MTLIDAFLTAAGIGLVYLGLLFWTDHRLSQPDPLEEHYDQLEQED